MKKNHRFMPCLLTVEPIEWPPQGSQIKLKNGWQMLPSEDKGFRLQSPQGQRFPPEAGLLETEVSELTGRKLSVIRKRIKEGQYLTFEYSLWPGVVLVLAASAILDHSKS